MDIKEAMDQFLHGSGKNQGKKPDERYASFDFCYNYFYSFPKEKRLPELANDNLWTVNKLKQRVAASNQKLKRFII